MKLLKIAFRCVVLLGTVAAAAAFYGLYHYGRGLPDYRQLAGITKATSPDGIRWQHNVDGQPWRPGGNGTNVLGWDPAAG